MTTVTVGATATLVAAADGSRGSLCVQHVDVTQNAVRVWVADRATVAVGDGLLLVGLGATITADRLSGARGSWYAIAEEAGVVVMVASGSKWDSEE